MSLISIKRGSKDFGIRTLFKNLDLNIKERERLGLIGTNGSGKSTLLKVIAGVEPLLLGTRICSPSIKISLASQEDADLAVNAAERIIHRSLDAKTHQSLIEEVLDDGVFGNNPVGGKE